MDEARRIAKTFPQRLKEALDEEGWTIYDLIFHSGLHESTIQAYMAGRVPKVENLAIIARTLDESADWLLGIFDKPRELNEIVVPSEEEAQVLMAVATENDNGSVPTFASIARFTGLSKQRAGQLVRRLQAAKWLSCEQAGYRQPGGLRVTALFNLWWGGERLRGRREEKA